MEELKPNEQRAKVAIAMIWIVFSVQMLMLLSEIFQYLFLQKITNGEDVTMVAAEANDSRQTLLAVLYLIAYIISTVTFIMWFRRAYSNLHTQMNHLQFSEGWAAGAWFVPVINLFRPYQIMKDLYESTQRLLAERLKEKSPVIDSSYIGLWWFFWLLISFLDRIQFKLSAAAESVEELTNSCIFAIITNILSIPLSIITVKVIRNYSNVEINVVPAIPENETVNIPDSDNNVYVADLQDPV